MGLPRSLEDSFHKCCWDFEGAAHQLEKRPSHVKGALFLAGGFGLVEYQANDAMSVVVPTSFDSGAYMVFSVAWLGSTSLLISQC